MNGREKSNPERLLIEARGGSRESVGPLLELFRNYLRLIARSKIDSRMRLRVNASDVVQESFMEAFRDFEQFQGETVGELVEWLKTIVNHNIARQTEKQLSAKKRDVRRELSLAQSDAGSGSSHYVRPRQLVSQASSPSTPAHRRELSEILHECLDGLPVEYRRVLTLRHLDQLSFEDIASRMNRSPGAVRMLWLRALDRIRQTIDPEDFQ